MSEFAFNLALKFWKALFLCTVDPKDHAARDSLIDVCADFVILA